MTGFLGTLDSAGPWAAFLALALLVSWMVFTGRLVPRRVHEEAVLAERRRADDWCKAAAAADARADLQGQQLAEILSFMRTRPREAA